MIISLSAGLLSFFPISEIHSQDKIPNERSFDMDETDDAYYDSLLNAYLEYDSLLLTEFEADSLSFLDLIDQLVSLDYSVNYLSLRTGYNSNILNAGRDFGFKQYGFSGGLTYNSKLGLYADITGYWNSEVEPNYNVTTTSLGYMGLIKPKWSIMASYDHYFYNENDTDSVTYYPLTNSLNLSNYFDFKWLSIGLDYGFLFGSETAHRIRPNISGVFRFKDIGFIDRITVMPGISGLWGNQTILVSTTNYQMVHQVIQRIGRREFRQLYEYNPEAFEVYTEENAFGLMNYSFNFPVFIYIGKFGLAGSYNLNFPVALPGEDIDLSMNSYFSLTASYTFFFK